MPEFRAVHEQGGKLLWRARSTRPAANIAESLGFTLELSR